MKRIKDIWQWLWIEPLTWIFYCFFQPVKFRREIERQGFLPRLRCMCQLAPLLFILIYPPTLSARVLLSYFCPLAYASYWQERPPLLDDRLFGFAFDSLWALALCIAVAVVGGAIIGILYGIVGSMVGGFWVGIVVRTFLEASGYTFISYTVIAFTGLLVGVGIGSARDITSSNNVITGIGDVIGLIWGILVGLPLGIVVAFGGTVVYNSQGAPAFPHLANSILGSTVSTALGATCGALIAGGIVGVIRGSVRTTTLSDGVERALSIGVAACCVASTAVGGVMGTATGALGEHGFQFGLDHYLIPNMFVVPVFIFCYMLGYYRLPLYPFSGFSTLLCYYNGKSNPIQIFEYLHHSSLYWDECTFLPLPCLKRLLYLGIEVDISQTLREITFILAERSTQITAVRMITREIIIRDLEDRETLPAISQASEQLSERIPPEAKRIDSRWQVPFMRLDDASREALRACYPLGRQSRQNAFEEMIKNLNLLKKSEHVLMGGFEDRRMRDRLYAIIEVWLGVAKKELSKLKDAPEDAGHIYNPYICGTALSANTQQFVGRRDLICQLEQALNQGTHRPTFFLTGERRMGKTSMINQLPILLGARYLTIIFDLQWRGISANVAAFLEEIADAIATTMNKRGMPVTKLDYAVLNEARSENEAAAYRLFDLWFKQAEAILEQENRTILIAFDEFEKLAASGKSRYFDLDLLLDWFRSIIQNRSRLALLFSGVKTLSEMEASWSEYFVNVKNLKVSFLHTVDAFRLITQPVNDYPSEQIFGDGVVEEIIRVTGKHPFLIQAVCSELIEILNGEWREQASIEDVSTAVELFFEGWWDHYLSNLWCRTTPEQAICLQSLAHLGTATLQQLVEHCGKDEKVVLETLHALRRRDLVTLCHGFYQITTPIFSEWVKRNREGSPTHMPHQTQG